MCLYTFLHVRVCVTHITHTCNMYIYTSVYLDVYTCIIHVYIHTYTHIQPLDGWQDGLGFRV
jgi:hypothetical protein